jgi:hypothetical protein
MRQFTVFPVLLGLSVLASCGGGGGGGCETCGDTTGGPLYSAVSGTVLDRNNLPLAGVSVNAYSHNNHTTDTVITDAQGNYTFPKLDANDNAKYIADYEIYAEKTGFGFYPSVKDAAALITRFDFNGAYKTLIRFVAPPSPTSTGNNFTAYGASDPVVRLPRTGQNTSYASGDDASASKGVAWPGTRFSDNADGTVTDHLTGLVWLKNANCKGGLNWSAALTAANQLASGTCGLTDSSTAGQWRMPNVNELESLVDVSRSNPVIAAAAPFTNVNLTNAYWSSTTYTALPTSAMAIRFSDGRWINGIDTGDGSFSNIKATSSNSLWAVKSGAAGTAGMVQVLATGVYAAGVGRYINNGGTPATPGDDASLQKGAPLTSPRFIDRGDGTLVDTVTGLTWLKKADCLSGAWSGVLTSISTLASGQCGLTDSSTPGQWRLPNRAEMLSLSDRAPTFPQAEYFVGKAQGNTGPTTGPVIFNNFVAFKYYWTSTTNAADTTQAWALFSCDFGVYNITKPDSLQYALAVR